MSTRQSIRAALALALGLYAAALYMFAWSDEPGGAADTPIYLMMADGLNPFGGAGGTASVARQAMVAAMFPPLHPLLMGLVGGSSNIAFTHALAVTWLLGALAVAFYWMRGQGLGAAPAGALVAAFALSPATLLLALESLSENLYLLLSLLHLLALSRADRTERVAERRSQLLQATGWLALALLTRSVAVALLPAFAIALSRNRERRLLAYLLAALGPLVLWTVVKSALGFSGTYGSAYASKLASFSPERVHAVGLAAWAQLGALAAGFSSAFALRPGPLENTFALLAGLAACVGGAARLRRLAPDAVYVAGYVLMIVAWPFPAHAGRFLYVVLPVLFCWAFEGAVALAGLRGFSRAALARVRVGVLVALVFAPLPSLAFIVGRYAEGRGRVYASFTHTPRWYHRKRLEAAVVDARFRQAIAVAQAGVAERIPLEACVWATDPLELSLRAKRLAYGPPPSHVEAVTFDAYVERCDYYFLSLRTLYPYEPFYPKQRLGSNVETLATFRGGSLPGNPVVAELVRRRRASVPGTENSP